MCPPCLQSLGECTHFNNSQDESNTKGKGSGGEGPEAGLAVGPLCQEDRGAQSWLSHLTGHGRARQHSRKQEARTLSQELNVFRKWPRREEGERLL